MTTTLNHQIDDAALVVLCNVPTQDQALEIARELLKLRLAACVNILPGLISVYRWEQTVQQEHEVQLQIKTCRSRYALLEQCLLAKHSYALPEIIALPIEAGLPAYLNWLTAETRPLE